MNISIRKAQKEDIPVLMAMIKELAEYEKAPLEVTNTESDMLKDGFSENSVFRAILAESNGEALGMALWFTSYSTWKGKCIYLEDIIVRQQYRKQGIGKILFNEVVKEAKAVNAKRLQWQVLEWNEPAINFYKKIGAVLDGEWINCKLTEEQIQNFKS